MFAKLINTLKRWWAPRYDLVHSSEENNQAVIIFVDDSGRVSDLTLQAHNLLGSHMLGQNLADVLMEETRRQIMQELMSLGIAPDKFSIEEIGHHSLINGEDNQNWLIRAWPNVPIAVSARIVPRYDEGKLIGYQVHIN